jgi:uncharacterized protein
MIHGGADTYITPEMAATLCNDARRSQSKELWVVPKAKHNQAIVTAGEAYHARVVAFFDEHLARMPMPAVADPMTETIPATVVQAALA